MKMYEKLARLIEARNNCLENGNEEWADRHQDSIEKLVEDHAPSGSGFDVGTVFNNDKSNENKLVFTTEFHHMNEAGFYTGWTDHVITVTPNLAHGYDFKVSGKDKNDIKELIYDEFTYFLDHEIE